MTIADNRHGLSVLTSGLVWPRPFSIPALVLGSLILVNPNISHSHHKPHSVEAKAAVLRFEGQVKDLESQVGAYGDQLTEQLLGYGNALEAEGQHKEAELVFKRGVHLARVNDGLHSEAQIPFLHAQISSLMSMEDYAAADDRQRYLHRLQTRIFEAGPKRASAFMQQADWHRSAYELAIGNNEGERLLAMRHLYRLAVTDIANVEGDKSASLLAPLAGLLRTQHLITRFDMGSYQEDGPYKTYSDDTQGLLMSAQSRTFKEGQAVIKAIYEIKASHQPEDDLRRIESMVQMGDWFLWNQKRRQAYQTYQTAIAELDGLEDAQSVKGRFFAEPVALPMIEDLRFYPAETDGEDAEVLLRFKVSARGKVSDVERLATGSAKPREIDRLVRRLRAVPFRPRFDGLDPVDTEQVTKAFKIAGNDDEQDPKEG